MRRSRSRRPVAGGFATAAAIAVHTGASSVADQAVASGQIGSIEQTADSRSLVQESDVPSRTAASCSCHASCVHRGCQDRWLDLDLRRADQAWSVKYS